MASEYTNSDSLRLLHTGAQDRGASQFDPVLCLGGKYSPVECLGLQAIVDDALWPIIIERISPACGAGEHEIYGVGSTELALELDGLTRGATVTVTDGTTVVLESTDASKAVRVRRDGDESLARFSPITLTAAVPFNNAIGMSDVASTAATAGLSEYRGLVLRNVSTGAISNIKAWVAPLASAVLGSTVKMASSGATTLGTRTTFDTFPEQGYASIFSSTGGHREIVYYTSRTSTVLTIPAAGRMLLGSTDNASSSGDSIYPVPGIRVALSSGDTNGDIITIADKFTAPAGVTWDTDLTAATGLSLSSLAVDTNYGLWIHRETPAGAFADAKALNQIGIQWEQGSTYSFTIGGYYRVANDALDRYEVYLGLSGSNPSFSSTYVAASTALPLSYTLASTAEHRLALVKRNKYNLMFENPYWRSVTRNSTNGQVTPSPTAPQNITLDNQGSGMLRLQASYPEHADSNPADTWSIYVSGAATASTSLTPSEIEMADATFLFRPTRMLDTELGPFADGVTISVLLHTQRSSDGTESTNGTAVSEEVTSMRPGIVTQRDMFYGLNNPIALSPPTIDTTTFVGSSSNNIRFHQQPGITDFYVDTALLFRIRYDSLDPANNGFWTTYAIIQDDISGASTAGPFEINSTTTFYAVVADTRRMKISTTGTTIHFKNIAQQASQVLTARGDDPALDMDWSTHFQVWDRGTWDYVSACSLDGAGEFATRVPWRQRQSTGDFE